jgi:hypothetical protein
VHHRPPALLAPSSDQGRLRLNHRVSEIGYQMSDVRCRASVGSK